MEQLAEIEETEAEYTVEAAVRCTGCDRMVETLHVLRLLRTKVNLTSTLPRRGFVIACPHCRSVFSGHLGVKIGI